MLARVSTSLAVLTPLLYWLPSPALAQRNEPTKNSPKVHEAFRQVVAQVQGSVVRVLNDGKEAALGTVVGAEGWILTKNSLLGDKIEIKLTDGAVLSAKVVGIKDDCDLALLKVQAKKLPAVTWQPSKNATVGDWVLAAGPGKDPVAVGIVSVATRTMGRRDYPPSTNPNSGFLGINLADNPDGGVKIGGVQDNTAAAKAGLKAGDVIVSIDGRKIPDPESLMSTIARYKPKDVVTIKFKRDGKDDEVKATLGARPRDLSRGDFQNRLGNEVSDRRGGFPAILQHDTILKPTECGGPLVDLDGKVVGINIARAGRIETYAIPSENVLALLDELKSGRLAPPGTKPDVTKPDVTKTDTKVRQLEEAVKEAARKLSAAEERVAAARKLLESATQAAEKFGKDNPDLIEAADRAKKLTTSSEKSAVEAKTTFLKARADLEKSRK